MAKNPTTIRMDEQTRTSLAILAQRDGRSMSNYLAALVMREAKLTGAIAPRRLTAVPKSEARGK